MTVTMPERLAFRGGAVKGHTIAPVAPTDLTISADALTDWPTGSDGRFQACIGRGLVNEEKVLVAIRSGAILTIAQRGWDGTQAVSHAAGETIEHVHTAHDADESNSHGSKVYAHGLASDEAVVGTRKAQILRNKTIDGGQNTLQNIPEGAAPEIAEHFETVEASVADVAADVADVAADLATEATARADGDTARYTKTEADALFEPIDSAYTKAEADTLFLTEDEADLLYEEARTDSGWVTSAAGFSAATGWAINSVRHRVVESGPLTLIDLYVNITRSSGGNISVPSDGNIGNVTVITAIPAALRPTASVGMYGPAAGGASGRMVSGYVASTGAIALLAVGGSVDFGNGQVFTMRGFYIQ